MSKTAAPRFARQRMLALAGAAAATLALGGLTACSSEDDPESATGSGGAEGEQAEENTEEDGGENGGTAEEEATEEGTDDGLFAAEETAVYDSGFEITVSAAEPYTPTDWAVGHTEGNAAYSVTVSLANNGEESVDTTFVLASARAGADGVTAETIYDDTVGTGFNGELLPGRTASAEYAFDAPPDAAALEVQIEQALELDSTPAIWEIPL
ncbi:DUF4352 domain-containing protein [Streptomyces johnsoniae]|uniref:DUF4352 domain-containing protein n=1 Tax=Streptomyces johnsoniae TaxID=3075532 RepID=A0ABU2RY96_9ACTN|nr:DUF4352 domain-containing protein [Streptomyces sp. DSM 41886]MDT0441685.1 DUF4352 domain-containing protein [Streptomyces sp. DSM 41886]